ncbi:plastocyanin [Caulobacter ginsengisoli]|uniref:Plastocyanin n=1 Tax=Caulobacter ginsengisoli TaxID=400775 RepID=A0ABU0IPC8_9CAUL|nr:methylamine utilization protein [Caulobacter ginsengisoli]MDQ0463863.1 plastocyanin [Caulobacter ginsengisoli]
MRPALAALIATLCLAAQAQAADLTVRLKNAAGQPIADAVVTVKPAAGLPSGPIRFDWPLRMSQQNIAFHPFVLIAPVGATVAFPNFDKVRHHVYSFSPAKKFELKLYGNDETRSVVFDKPGVVALGCNIHDQMLAFIRVVDTPYAAKTDASGLAVIRGLPSGAATATIWQPYLRAPKNEMSRPVSVTPAGASLNLTAEVRPPAPMKM